MLLFGLTIGVICFAGLNYAMQYISPIVFSSVMLVDPAVTGLIAWFAGLEGIPDVLTVAGGVIVIVGVAIISVGERRREGDPKFASYDDSDDIELTGTQQNPRKEKDICIGHQGDLNQEAPDSSSLLAMIRRQLMPSDQYLEVSVEGD
jgi:hypothetical protein